MISVGSRSFHRKDCRDSTRQQKVSISAPNLFKSAVKKIGYYIRPQPPSRKQSCTSHTSRSETLMLHMTEAWSSACTLVEVPVIPYQRGLATEDRSHTDLNMIDLEDQAWGSPSFLWERDRVPPSIFF